VRDGLISEGELVGLRPVVPDDAGLLYECWHDPDVQRNFNFREPDTPVAEWWSANAGHRSWLECVVVELASGSSAGEVSLGSVPKEPQLVMLLLPEFRGRGLGTEAARLIIDYGFAVMGLASVGGGAFDFNAASQRLLEKLGFARCAEEDGTYPNAWGEGEVTEIAYRLDRATWERSRAPKGPVRPHVFDARPALETIKRLDMIRLCGSEGERQAMQVIAEQLENAGVGWHYHTFRDRWLEPEDPRLTVRGRTLAVRPALEVSFQSDLYSKKNDVPRVDVTAALAPAHDCAGGIAVADRFDPQCPVRPEAAAQLMAFPFDPEIEPYLWAQTWEGKRVQAAWVMNEDVAFVMDTLGEPATLSWGAKEVDRDFRNLVAEIPGVEKPQEIVIMGAHIDTFPGTVGSADAAAGCAVLVEAARWFAANPPARTVRLVWFTGEELDARGSRRYVSECLGDPRVVKLMVEADGGCEMYTGPFTVYTSDGPTIEWARRRLNLDGWEHSISTSPGTDARHFIAAGIPAFMPEAPSKQGPHLPDDRPENIDPHKLQVLGSLCLDAAICAACDLSP